MIGLLLAGWGAPITPAANLLLCTLVISSLPWPAHVQSIHSAVHAQGKGNEFIAVPVSDMFTFKPVSQRRHQTCAAAGWRSVFRWEPLPSIRDRCT